MPMPDNGNSGVGMSHQRGATMFLAAVSLVVLLLMSALAIDVGMLYVVHTEAQRAADAAALAGAKKFVESGFTSGLTDEGTVQDLSRQEAFTIGAQNLVGGLVADIRDEDVSFDFSNPGNPLITVTVRRVAARGNPVPTLFAKVVGIKEVDLMAAATAEAFNPSGGNTPISTSCIKPWILPNCDPSHTDLSNTLCQGKANFVDGSTGSIVNPGPTAANGVVGQLLVLKQGRPQDAAAPSQFYPIDIPPGTEPALCPDCATGGGGGGALYRRNIACCNTSQLSCGQTVDVNLEPGNMVGPTRQGVECLIHQLPNGRGQDVLDVSIIPFQIQAGSNNPLVTSSLIPVNSVISSSDSIVTIPLYDGHQLCPGGSCTFSVTVVGFLQVFITEVDKGAQGRVRARILNVVGCGIGGSSGSGGSGSGPGGAAINAGGSLLPVRLVRPRS